MMHLEVVFYVLAQMAEAAATLSGTVKQYVSPPFHFRVNHKKRRLYLTIEDDD